VNNGEGNTPAMRKKNNGLSSGATGVRESTACSKGAPRNLGDPSASVESERAVLGVHRTAKPLAVGDAPGAGRANHGATTVPMREETKRSGMGEGKSECPSSTDEAGEPTRGTLSREGGHRIMEPREGHTATIEGSRSVSSKLARVAKLARDHRGEALTSLSHLIDVEFLREAFERTRKGGATGIDGQTSVEFAQHLDKNLESLLARFKSEEYFAPAVRRVHIPKGDGASTRPIGIPTFEDKVLQRAVSMILEAIYEEEFLPFSFGFRPRRSAHQAVQSFWLGAMGMRGGFVIEVDIKGFFDTLEHSTLRDLLDQRVRDGVIRRTINKWLKAGVLENAQLTRSSNGSPQGGVISPVLANVYLHHVFDLWLQDDILPRLRGRATVVRYADDIAICLEREDDARRLMKALPQRFERFGLTLHPEKTRLVRFVAPPDPQERTDERNDDDGPGSFDLLGFTHYWGLSRNGKWIVKRKTASSRMQRTLKSLHAWCRKVRHWRVRDQHEALSRKLRGHYAYYGITNNGPALSEVYYWATRIWRYWLNRRSQQRHMPWHRFKSLLERYPLPPARIVHSYLRSTASP